MNMELRQVRDHLCYVAGVPTRKNLSEVRPDKWLDREAAFAFSRMAQAALKVGIDLVLVSAWRSMPHQQRLYAEWEQGKRKFRPARPGWSLHQSGMAVDILRSHDDPDGGGPLVGATDKWLEEHAAEFGFYRTVPGEPWHYEYKGEMHDDGRGRP